jgi:hypothetical protein
VEQRAFGEEDRRDRLLHVLVPAPGFGGQDAPDVPDGGAVTVHQDAAVLAGLLGPGVRVEHRFRPGFGGFFFVVHGQAVVRAVDGSGATDGGGLVDEGGDARIAGIGSVAIEAGDPGAEVLLVETRLDRSAEQVARSGQAEGSRGAEPDESDERRESAA